MALRSVLSPMKRHKYGAKKTAIIFKGKLVTFDSIAESVRAVELQRLEMAGEIKALSLQPSFTLQQTMKVRGKTVRSIVYKADFEYLEDGQAIIEDVKGVQTPVFKLKMKLFLTGYPKLVLRLSKRGRTGFTLTDH